MIVILFLKRQKILLIIKGSRETTFHANEYNGGTYKDTSFAKYSTCTVAEAVGVDNNCIIDTLR